MSTFAIDTLLLGDLTEGADGGSIDWKSLGLNIDGLVTTTPDAGDVCASQPDASSQTPIDGMNGIDNAFGAILLSAIPHDSEPSRAQTQAIQAGSWTLQLQVMGLTGDVNQTANGLDVQVFVGAPLLSPPTFDGQLDWGVVPSSLRDGKSFANGALVHFTNAYISHGTIVARDATAPLVLPLTVWSIPSAFVLTVHHATLAFTLSDPNTVRAGTLAGVLSVDDLLANVPPCAQPAQDYWRATFAGASDILDDGSNTPGRQCDAISIGLGFTARRIANPDFVSNQPSNNSCGDAGSD